MKSSFLLLVILGALVTSVAFGQTQKTSKPIANTPAVIPTTVLTEAQKKDAFQRFSARLKIGYFSAYQSSSLGQWSLGASDEYGVRDRTYVPNLFNQVSFNYNFGAKMNFVINPRWTINTASTKKYGENKGMLAVEDMLIGFQGVILSSEDKKFNWWMRAAARLPTSRGSRAANITMQPETYSQLTYDFTKKWQMAGYIQNRHWVYEDRYTLFRYRIYVAPYVQYTINDTTRMQLYLENYSENRGLSQSQNHKNPVFKTYWSNTMIAMSKDITPKLNFMPFIGYFLNVGSAPKGSATERYAIQQRPLDPAWFGFWLSYQIK